MLYYKKECAALEADRNMFSFSVPKNAMFYFFSRKKNQKNIFGRPPVRCTFRQRRSRKWRRSRNEAR